MSDTPGSVFERIEKLLEGHGVEFDVLRHESVYTSEEAAAIRGTPLASGAKALVCKACIVEELATTPVPLAVPVTSRSVGKQRHADTL